MTKREALAWGGGPSALARKLRESGYPITPQAISKWRDGPIPELRRFQIREIQRREQHAA